jgi:hypothetical protein
MDAANTRHQDAVLYSYRIASADMKYIEINTREIFLRDDPASGLILRGEIPECGPFCHADLSEVFLEYAMSCKGCEESSVMLASTVEFGERLGKNTAARFRERFPGRAPEDLVPSILECVLTSLGAGYQTTHTAERLSYRLAEPPLDSRAGGSGLNLLVDPAFKGFLSFVNSILTETGGRWKLVSPTPDDLDIRLTELHLDAAG